MFLIRLLGLRGTADVLDLVAQYYPPERIPAKTRFFVQEICDARRPPGSRTPPRRG